MKIILHKYSKWALILIPFSLLSYSQVNLDSVKIEDVKNIDTPAGGTKLGIAKQKAHSAEANEELQRQKIDSLRIANN